MAEFIKMPTLGFDMEEGTMGTWLVDVGAAVSIGDVLAEIESDKVTQELIARVNGIMLARVGKPGDSIPVGALLGIVGAEGEDIATMMEQLHGGRGRSAPAPASVAEPPAQTEAIAAAPSTPPSGDAIGEEFPDGVKATPVARRMAADKRIDLKAVNGSGPGGRIQKRDVESFVPSAAIVPAVVVTLPVERDPVKKPERTDVTIEHANATIVPATRLRQAIARRMTESVNTIPPFYVTMAIDVTDALALRKQLNGSMPEGESITVNDIMVKATGVALREFPNLNSSWGGDKVIQHNQINIGTAVAIDGGLLTVVSRNTDKTAIGEIARQNKAMIGRAREGKVSSDDIQGSTFTTSNLGAFGVDNFIGIINPPEAAILTIGGANKQWVMVNGELTERSIMKVTISADHRITDGAEAAAFLVHLKGIVENPMKLLI